MKRKTFTNGAAVKIKIIIALVLPAVLATCLSCVQREGRKREITVISREDGSGTRRAFDELMNITDGKTSALFREAIIVSSADEAASKVEVDKHAIGYTSLGSLNDKVKALLIDGIAANETNIKNGTYCISRPFVIAARKDASNPIIGDFITFIMSANGQRIVHRAEYVPINDDGAAEYSNSGMSGKITLSGSFSVEKVMEKLREEYIKLNPSVKIEINYNGSSAGIRDCINTRSDLALSSRELKPEEKELLDDTRFALDGIAVIVNRSNVIDDISSKMVTQVFKGFVRYWADLIELIESQNLADANRANIDTDTNNADTAVIDTYNEK